MKTSTYLWLLPFLSFLCGYQLIRSLYTVNTLTTPSIIGKEIQDAIKILSDNNLNPRILTEKEDPIKKYHLFHHFCHLQQ